MKCAFCKKEICEEEEYASIDIADHRLGRYMAVICCDGCVHDLPKKKDGTPLLNGTSRYSVWVRRVKERKSVITEPLRSTYDAIWMFAKPQVDGAF